MTSRSSSLRDSETRLLVSIINCACLLNERHSCLFFDQTAHVLFLNRVHHSHDEENPKGTSQGNFAQVAGRGTQYFFYLIYYIRKERERWTSSPRSLSFKSTASTLRTRLSARWSRRSVSRDSSPARERDSPRNELSLITPHCPQSDRDGVPQAHYSLFLSQRKERSKEARDCAST